MKKMLLMLLFAIPMLVTAQSREGVKLSNEGPEASGVMFYGEIINTTAQNGGYVRVQFDQGSLDMIREKSLSVDVLELGKMRFTSFLNALNTVSAKGWTIGEMYTVQGRAGEEMHVLISKKTTELVPGERAKGSPAAPSKTKGKR